MTRAEYIRERIGGYYVAAQAADVIGCPQTARDFRRAASILTCVLEHMPTYAKEAENDNSTVDLSPTGS